MEQFTFLKNYRDNEENRSSLNSLMQLSFGFTLETWYQTGGWQEQYIPYSFTDGTQIVANVSLYKESVLHEGQEKTAIRLEHIMVHPKYAHRNLIEKLIYKITEEYMSQVDLIYLVADEAVTPFYPRFGFEHMEAVYNYIEIENVKKGEAPIHILVKDIFEKIKEAPERYQILSETLQSKNNYAFRKYAYMTRYSENLYYFENLDTYVIAQIKEGILEIIDIIGAGDKAIDLIIQGFRAIQNFSRVKINCDMTYTGSYKIIQEVGDALVFIKSASIQEENLFPIIIEA